MIHRTSVNNTSSRLNLLISLACDDIADDEIVVLVI